jgi:hypothetical protein
LAGGLGGVVWASIADMSGKHDRTTRRNFIDALDENRETNVF